MKVLMITGDKNLLKTGTEASRRLDLQRAQCERLDVVYWGRGSWWPKIPAGKFDIVTAQDLFWRGLFSWYAARRMRAKLQIQIHTNVFSSSFATQSLGNRLKVQLAKFCLRRANCVRVVTSRIKDSLKEVGVTQPVSVLHIFVDGDAIKTAATFSFLSSQEHWNKRFDKIILVAARLEKEKNVDDAIGAMSEILKSFPEAGLLIAGDGSQKEALQQLTRELGVEESVVFLGRRDDVYSLYKGADCCVAATAEYEGYGASTVEALAAGCPVVSRDIGIAREAGAIIAQKSEIAHKVIDVLKSGAKGHLKLHLPSAEEWAKQWYADISACCR